MSSRPADSKGPDSKGRGLTRLAVVGAIAVAAPLGLSGTANAAEITSSPVVDVTGISAAAPASGGVWDKLARCESGGNWRINTGNGYYGGLQFSARTWRAHGGKGMPHRASKAEQIRIAQKVLRTQGWRAWPACSRKLGLRG